MSYQTKSEILSRYARSPRCVPHPSALKTGKNTRKGLQSWKNRIRRDVQQDYEKIKHQEREVDCQQFKMGSPSQNQLTISHTRTEKSEERKIHPAVVNLCINNRYKTEQTYDEQERYFRYHQQSERQLVSHVKNHSCLQTFNGLSTSHHSHTNMKKTISTQFSKKNLQELDKQNEYRWSLLEEEVHYLRERYIQHYKNHHNIEI